jgi:hypothetical protein
MLLVKRFAILLALILMLTPAVLFAAAPRMTAPEGQLFAALNRERAAQGLPTLVWDDDLASAARLHAERMAQLNQMSHQLPGEADLLTRASGAGARFSMVAENVAVGPDPGTIHSAWMHSSGHRANILSSELNAVGIAVAQGSMGLFAVQDFSQGVGNFSLEQQEQHVISLLAARGLQAVSGTPDERAACDFNRGFPANHPPLEMRYETSSLAKFPDGLEQQLQSGRFRSAAVAACRPSSASASGFARFRIAILLF